MRDEAVSRLMRDKVAHRLGSAFPAQVLGPVEWVIPAVSQPRPVADVVQPRRGDQGLGRRWRHRRHERLGPGGDSRAVAQPFGILLQFAADKIAGRVDQLL